MRSANRFDGNDAVILLSWPRGEKKLHEPIGPLTGCTASNFRANHSPFQDIPTLELHASLIHEHGQAEWKPTKKC